MKNIRLRTLFLRGLCILSVTVFSPLFAYASGGFLITEIMFDPSGGDANREWVEIQNSSSASVDISGYIFQSDGPESSHHSLAPVGSSSVPGGGYAVIVQNVDAFKADYPGFSGLVFDSSWTGLTATSGKTLVIRDDADAVLDQVTYNPTVGGANDGNSQQKNATGVWIAAAPTPGAENTSTTENTDTDTTTTTTGGGGSGSGSGSGGGGSTTILTTIATPKVIVPPHMQANISIQKVGSVGVSIPFSINVLGYDSEKRYHGSFHTAFGDGTAYDAKDSEPFDHIYHFPGTYVISFEYKSNPYDKKPEITARAKIDITVAGVVISSVLPNGSIELKNNGDREADLSDWSLQSGDVVYHIPSGTILLSSAKIILPIEITKFVTPVINPQLLLPSGVVFMKYGDMITPSLVEISAPAVVYAKANTTVPIVADYSVSVLSDSKTASPKIASDALSANAIGSFQDEIDVSNTKKRSALPYIFVTIGIIIASIIALFKYGGFSEKTRDSENEINREESTKSIADKITIIDE